MNRILIFILPFLIVNCSNNNQQFQKTEEIPDIIETQTNGFTVNDDLYKIQLEIETNDDNNSRLSISFELFDDSYFVSPMEKRDFSGKFYMDLGSYIDLDFAGELLEHPASVRDVERNVNVVRIPTTYKQLLNIKTDKDFEVFGRVKFVIEPSCTKEEIPFRIFIHDGKIGVDSPKC